MMTDQASSRPNPLAAASPQGSAGARAEAENEFEQLFLAHYHEIYRHLYRLAGEAQAAEDLAQETFLRLYQQRFGSHRTHRIRAWLYRVASNLAYNAGRSDQRRRRREALPQDEHWSADPAEIVQRGVDQALVRQALAQLPERDAQLLLLRHAGLSYRELAEVLDVAPGSVGTLLARAHKSFQEIYRGAVEAPPGEECHGL